jgi:glycosyltransferase involved in cell wall biosynthesis
MNPFLDFDFFRFCNKHNVPVGLFYRDIYWLFDEYYKNVSFLKGSAARLFYYYDLFFYKRLLTKLYLPSLEMGNYIPIVNRSIFSALPPGHSSTYTKNYIIKKVDQAKTLNLLYVGGLSNNYRMHVLFKVLKKFPNIEFTLCTREQEWLDLKEEYPSLSPNIKVVHKSGEDVGVLLLESDIVSLFVEPGEYWSFAAPFKLYEYLGYNKPIIATIGTMSGEFVNENSIGWAIPYKEEALKVLFTQLSESPEMIREAVENMGHVALVNTWRDRAAQVASDLARHL